MLVVSSDASVHWHKCTATSTCGSHVKPGLLEVPMGRLSISGKICLEVWKPICIILANPPQILQDHWQMRLWDCLISPHKKLPNILSWGILGHPFIPTKDVAPCHLQGSVFDIFDMAKTEIGWSNVCQLGKSSVRCNIIGLQWSYPAACWLQSFPWCLVAWTM